VGEATLDHCVAESQAKASRTEALTSDEWAQLREAIHNSYIGAGAVPPAAVIRARSPMEAMAMALAHQADQAMAEVNASTRIVRAIADREDEVLGRMRSFSGDIAARVDRGTLSPQIWGGRLHPQMRRPPCTGNMQPGVAAEVTWMLEHGQVSLSMPVRRGADAIIGRSLGGPARLLTDLVFVSDMPTQFLTDDEGKAHHDSGPAIAWSDGAGVNVWHGTGVPADFFRWSIERALSEVNVEVRRCAFERIGVERLERSLRLLDEAPDPANPPHVLRLYDLPRPWLSGRLLVVDNASLDKGGHRRRFYLFVPPHISDPVEAAANSFGMTSEQYARMQRAT
jgi:hypothetical protein